MIGRDSYESVTYLVKALELPFTPEFYLEERNELLEECIPFAQPKPGGRELIGMLSEL